jgi:hypothetical protein
LHGSIASCRVVDACTKKHADSSSATETHPGRKIFATDRAAHEEHGPGGKGGQPHCKRALCLQGNDGDLLRPCDPIELLRRKAVECTVET